MSQEFYIFTCLFKSYGHDITIDNADNVYNRLREFHDTLPFESIKAYEADLDFLTADEKDELYNIQEKTKNRDFSDFEDWDSMKKKSGNI